VVAGLSFLIIFVAEKTISRSNERHAQSFQVLSSILVAQVLIVLSSSFKRLLMYEGAYGFTLPRFYAHVVLILLVAVFLLLLYKTWVQRPEALFAGLRLITLLVFLGGVNFMNPDLFVARHNIARYVTDKTQPLDAWYLSRLSDDAVPELIRIFDDATILEKRTREELGNSLYYRAQSKQSSSDRDSQWQSWHVARVNARQLLSSRAVEFEKYKEYYPEGLLPPLPLDVAPREEVLPQMQRIQ